LDVEWDNLQFSLPPYVPDVSIFPSCTNMRDGSSDEWLEEGEATPIIDDDINRFYRNTDNTEDSFVNCEHDSGNKWQNFLIPGEKLIFTGITWKRKVSKINFFMLFPIINFYSLKNIY